jgi:phosphoserine aminotransferase
VSQKIYFTPGPAQLYPTAEAHLKQALWDDIPSISHRSNQFRVIYQDTVEALKQLLGLPDNYAVLFTGSATEIWERLMQNCVEETSFHLVNGEFSKKFYEFGALLGKKALKQEVEVGKGFEVNDIQVDYKAELVAVVHNETSTGVITSEADIHQIKQQNSKRLVVVDMVSSAPYPQLDFKLIDSAYFSVQKAFGLPAGLGVWLANEKCLAKAEMLENKKMITGAHHRLSNLWKFFEKYETPSTPNVLGIYLLGKIAQDMLQKGIATIRAETDQKAQILYDFLAKDARFEPFVQNPAHRSPTVIVANTTVNAPELIKKISEQGLIMGSGYQTFKEKQIRIANFPAVSVEAVEQLCEALQKAG